MRTLIYSVLLVGASATTGTLHAQQEPRTLYQRLGGYDAVAAVTDDFIGRLVADTAFKRFFAGHSTNSLQRIRQLIVDQLCAATGGALRLYRAGHEDGPRRSGY